MKNLALKVLGGSLLLATSTFAQQTNTQGGTLPLPEGVKRVIAIDAQNQLLAEVEDENGNVEYRSIPVRHVYAGGIAKVLGGDIIPTEPFVSPAFTNGGAGYGNNGNNVQQFGGNGYNNGNNNGFNNGNNNGWQNGSNFNSGFGGFVGNGRVAPRVNVPTTQMNRQMRNRNLNNRRVNQVVGFLDRPIPQVEVGQ
jgi:hypothetical protein